MRLYVEDVLEDGDHVIHARHPEKHGKSYILFLPDGDFQIGLSSGPGGLLPEKESAYRKISDRHRRPELVRHLSMLESNAAVAGPEVIVRIRAIVSERSDPTANRLIDELVSDLKIARKWNRSNGQSQSIHARFVSVLRQLIKSRKGKPIERLPFKHEIADLLKIESPNCSKLCKANGFRWLPNGRPQDALVHSVRQNRI